MVEQKNLFNANPLAYRQLNPHSRLHWAINKGANVVRFSLAGIFFWFGVLKLTGVSPVVELLRHSIPILAEYPYVQLLGMAEVLIALGLVIDKLSRPASALMMLNLVCILGIVVPAPALIFAQGSPGVTTQGAFLAYYIVFILAGLLILGWRQRQVNGYRSSAPARYRESISRPLY
jgi:uncharacterized membrane protein YphA (DoxX/SURF4 family)